MLALNALADPTRQRIVEMLAVRELSAGAIADSFDVTAPKDRAARAGYRAKIASENVASGQKSFSDAMRSNSRRKGMAAGVRGSERGAGANACSDSDAPPNTAHGCIFL